MDYQSFELLKDTVTQIRPCSSFYAIYDKKTVKIKDQAFGFC